jgi:hypothetical protein
LGGLYLSKRIWELGSVSLEEGASTIHRLPFGWMSNEHSTRVRSQRRRALESAVLEKVISEWRNKGGPRTIQVPCLHKQGVQHTTQTFTICRWVPTLQAMNSVLPLQALLTLEHLPLPTLHR